MSIIRRGGNDRWIRRFDVIRMHKVDMRAGRHITKRRRDPLKRQFVPAHMRNLKGARLGRCVPIRTVREWEPPDCPRHNIQTLVHAEFYAFRKQYLKAKTDA